MGKKPEKPSREDRTVVVRFRVRPSEFEAMAERAGDEERVNLWVRDLALRAAGKLKTKPPANED